MNAKPRVVTTLWLTAAACATVALGCGDGSIVFTGRRLVEARGCLESAAAIDVVEASEAASGCHVLCLIGSSPLALEGTVYVSDQCPPYPPAFDVSGSDPRCEAALAAWERGDSCKADGSSSNPIAPPTSEEAGSSSSGAAP